MSKFGISGRQQCHGTHGAPSEGTWPVISVWLTFHLQMCEQDSSQISLFFKYYLPTGAKTLFTSLASRTFSEGPALQIQMA